jgi:transcription elongation factor Elf1
MKAVPPAITCPECGSRDVVYSCEPECCFNHVCGNCLASFELFTADLGGELSGVSFEEGERDCLSITVSCARCESLNVSMVEGEGELAEKFVCGDCHASLRLGFKAG